MKRLTAALLLGASSLVMAQPVIFEILAGLGRK